MSSLTLSGGAPPAPSRSFVIAHRGASALFPENTLLAFRKAIESGVRHLECDVRLTRDKVPVVIHDRTLDRTTSGRGEVSEASHAEVRRLTAGEPARFGDRHASERVPSLEEVLRLARGDAHLFIELKEDTVGDPGGVRLVAAVADLISAAGAGTWTTLLAFETSVLAKAAELADRPGLGLLWDGKSRGNPLLMARVCGARALILEQHALTPELAEAVRAKGLSLGTYLVDSDAELESALRFGPLGIATNSPERLAAHPAFLTR